MSNGWFVSVDKPEKCLNCESREFKQDEDTFDTWFSSAQWPFATLMSCSNSKSKKSSSKFYKRFYPTSVMETGYDIFRAWVSRMIMIGYFVTGQVPFKNIFGHGLVRDRHGQKMSKSKGNVVNPMIMVDKYGADALRAALIFEVKEGNDLSFVEEKVIGMRNFINKIWNIGRFIEINIKDQRSKIKNTDQRSKIIMQLEKEFTREKKEYLKFMESYRFSKALGLVYEFLWHRYADIYIEQLKDDVINGNIKALEVLKNIYFENLKMLHPFVPFVTEAIFQVFFGEKKSILETNFQ
jgi:valyl-tRNA synthetase